MGSATATDEIGAILAVLGPWLHVHSHGQPYAGLLTGRVPSGPYSFDALVMPEMARVGPEVTARDVRAYLLGRAEDALEALAGAGWHLTACPRMEFGGDVQRFAQYLDGTLAEPSKQRGISLRMRFEVDRPR